MKEYNVLDKAYQREIDDGANYWNYNKDTPKGFYIDNRLVGMKGKIQRLHDEIEITTYPKRLKKLRKEYNNLRDLFPEEFI